VREKYLAQENNATSLVRAQTWIAPESTNHEAITPPTCSLWLQIYFLWLQFILRGYKFILHGYKFIPRGYKFIPHGYKFISCGYKFILLGFKSIPQIYSAWA